MESEAGKALWAAKRCSSLVSQSRREPRRDQTQTHLDRRDRDGKRSDSLRLLLCYLRLSVRKDGGEAYLFLMSSRAGLTKDNLRIGFIGAGKVGAALAILLSQRGYQVVAIASRTFGRAQELAAQTGAEPVEDISKVAGLANLVFITSSDDAIRPIVEQVAARGGWRAGHGVVHTSGVHTSEILAPAAKAGARVASMHPLQTLASAGEALQHLPGSSFTLEGDAELRHTLEELVTALGAHWFAISAADKPVYHAGSCIACNYTVTLFSLAVSLYEGFGLSSAEATAVLLPLLRGTVDNLANVGLPGALTGPIARGDVGTVQLHLEALAQRAPGTVEMYCHMGLQTLPIALAKGQIDGQKAREIEHLLQSARNGRNGTGGEKK